MRWLYHIQQHVALTSIETTVLLVLAGLLMLGSGVHYWRIQQVPPLTDAVAVPPDSSQVATDSDSLAPDKEASESVVAAAPPPAVNINTADAEALQQLTGIGPALAERIIAHRDVYGGFRSVDDLQRVSGIGPRTVETIADEAVATPPGAE